VQQQFARLMAAHVGPDEALATLHETEIRNLPLYGYGVKAFILSMIESAIKLSGGRVASGEVASLLAAGKDMLAAEVHLLEGAKEAVTGLAADFPLMIITKGDLGHQASKLERSGLAKYFQYVEIVPDKTQDVYISLFAKHGVNPKRVLMAGNSLKSDVIPVLQLGGWGVFIPYRILWTHEHAVLPPELTARFREIERIDTLPALVRDISA
jgi:putative hydrolase of the HAD superfamily